MNKTFNPKIIYLLICFLLSLLISNQYLLKFENKSFKSGDHEYSSIFQEDSLSYIKEAERIKGDTSENLIGLLERRLDAIVYRAKFVPTVFSARQFINHGHVKVNGRRVNIPSYRIKTTDIIEIKDKSRGLEIVLRGTESSERDIPEYIEVDSKKMTAKITKIPNLGEVPYPVTMEPNLVVEFYSRN